MCPYPVCSWLLPVLCSAAISSEFFFLVLTPPCNNYIGLFVASAHNAKHHSVRDSRDFSSFPPPVPSVYFVPVLRAAAAGVEVDIDVTLARSFLSY